MKGMEQLVIQALCARMKNKNRLLNRDKDQDSPRSQDSLSSVPRRYMRPAESFRDFDNIDFDATFNQQQSPGDFKVFEHIMNEAGGRSDQFQTPLLGYESQSLPPIDKEQEMNPQYQVPTFYGKDGSIQ
jgi:hypothetical protein